MQSSEGKKKNSVSIGEVGCGRGGYSSTRSVVRRQFVAACNLSSILHRSLYLVADGSERRPAEAELGSLPGPQTSIPWCHGHLLHNDDLIATLGDLDDHEILSPRVAMR